MYHTGPGAEVINNLEAKILELKILGKKYPHLRIESTWEDERYVTCDVNKTVDQFEHVSASGYNFYLLDGNYKIYADPSGCYTETDEGYEFNWLPEIIDDEINPLVLIRLMRHINSMY